jgi:hypothetical protein
VKVLVDTSVWSMALRRPAARLSAAEAAVRRSLEALVEGGQAQIIGLIRQELLTGIRHEPQFLKLRDRLRMFHDEPLRTEDYEHAARAANLCRAAGIAGSTIDYLICAVAARRKWPIFTTDNDFRRYARHLPITLYVSSDRD